MIPCILEADDNSKVYQKNWARLIQRIYEADPLVCPKCQGQMRIISFIEDPEVIKKILKHLGLWLVKRKPQPLRRLPVSPYPLEAPVFLHTTAYRPTAICCGIHPLDTQTPSPLYYPHRKGSSYQSGWPNQGVGRINPDRSMGSCTSCHTWHHFSIEIARKPYTCSECHKGPDVPAYKVYQVSKHGNIFSSLGKE